MVRESETVDPRDDRIFDLEQSLLAAESRIRELEEVVRDRIHPASDRITEIPSGANSRASVFAEEEKPYRRGYHQGFSLCRQFIEEAIKRGKAASSIMAELNRCEGNVVQWRGKAVNWTRGKIVKAIWPPRPTF